MARYENDKQSDGSMSGKSKGVEGSYGKSRGSKGAEKTVVQEDDRSDGGGAGAISTAASNIYRAALKDGSPGEPGASLDALRTR
jgi:hypothetical protein